MKTNKIAQAEQQAEIYQIFSNPKRILIMWILDSQEMSVGDIAINICATIQSTSQHLRLMRDKGLLVHRREGQMIYYRIATNKLGKRSQKLLHHIRKSQEEI
jgi:DNA-binding transcriptional ArsR family regulator